MDEQSLTGDQNVTGNHDVTGCLDISEVSSTPVTGNPSFNGNQLVTDSPCNTHKTQVSPVTGGPSFVGDLLVTGGPYVTRVQKVTGKPCFELATSWLQKARQRLSLSLRRKKIMGDQTRTPGNSETKIQENEGKIEIDSDDSVEYIPPNDLPGNAPARWVFIPVSQNSRRHLAGLFGMNKKLSLP